MANSILNPAAAKGLSQSPQTMQRMGLPAAKQQAVGNMATAPNYAAAIKMWTGAGQPQQAQQQQPQATSFQDFMQQQASYFDPFQSQPPLQTYTPGGSGPLAFGEAPLQAKVKQKADNPLLKMLRTSM